MAAAGNPNPPPAGQVLIVDDDLGLLRLVEKSLRREGFDTASTTSGKEAVAWLDQRRADLLLLDLNLPDIAGQELIRQLSANGKTVPFIVITGHSDVHVAVDMMRQGAVDYLVKDRQFLELVPTVVQRAMAQLEQKKRLAATEAALRVSAERFRVALKNSPITVFNQDRELRYTWVHNFPAERPGQTVLGKKSEDVFQPEEAARLTRIQRRVLATGVGAREEVCCTAGGRTLTYDLTVEPVRDSAGQILGVTCAAMDITERKRAERRQRLQYATTLALAKATSLPEAVLQVVQAVCESLGWSHGEFWGVDSEANVLRFVESWQPRGVEYPEFEAFSRDISFAPGVGFIGRVWARREPSWVPHINQNPHFTRARVAAQSGLRSACALPILLGGEVLGVLVFFSREVHQPDADLLQVFAAIGSQFGQFIERKRAEEALKQEHAFISAVLDTSGALVVVLDRDGRIVRFNRACEQIAGYAFNEVKGQFFWDLFVIPEELAGVKDAFQQLAAGKFPSQRENGWRTRTGEVRSITWSNTILAGKDGRAEYVIGTGIDTTERKRLEKEISQISEREQRRIGQDLHDGLCQHLAGIEFMSQVLQQKLAAKAKAEAASAAEITSLVREAISHTRDLARGLSPVVLESEGLMSALQELADNTEKLFHITCRFRCGVPVLIHDNAVATHLYRIAQEAVNNALKHGKAKRIDVSLMGDVERITLAVKDHGVGLPTPAPRSGGMGLRIMHYRAGMIGGLLTVQSLPEGGVRVQCVLKPPAGRNSTPTTYDEQKERPLQ